MDGVISVEERQSSKTGRNAKNNQRNTCGEKKPLSWGENKGAVENKDIAINHDSIWQKTVEHINKETKAGEEPAESRTHPHNTEPENSRDIGQTEEAVDQEHVVEEGQAVLLDGVLDQADIDDDNASCHSDPRYLENCRGGLPDDKIWLQTGECTKNTKLPAFHLG